MSEVHVHLRVGAERYALPVADVRSIVDMEGLAPVLGMPRAVLGLRALDGALLPVLDLARLLGIAGATPTRIVVVETAGTIGLAVDEVLDVAELPGLDEGSTSERLQGTVLLDGVLVGAIDLPAVLESLETELAA
ncbi:MAG TPA: chemotaxis protein CheW [Conexibacter sp.]|nr:chemotaxis protein CheW [Conexibacter sp.]